MSKTGDLIKSLKKRTDGGKLGWKQTADENVYQVSFPKYSIQISQEDSTDPAASGFDIAIRIFNSEGNIVEEIRDWHSPVKSDFEKPYAYLTELFTQARRQAMGMDEAYDYLLKELNDDLPF